MSRIFISMHYMELGGAERALLGLLEALSETEHQVDLFIYSHQGELMSFIPEGINLLPENPIYACYEKPIVEIFKQGHLAMGLARLWAKIAEKIFNKHTDPKLLPSSIADEMGRFTNAVVPNLNYLGEYDLAISFLNPHYYLVNKVLARKKIGWFHTDYSAISINSTRELPIWSKLDRIIAISHLSRNAFLQKFPSLADRTLVIENILPTRLIKHQANEFDASAEMPGAIKLLTVGRFAHAKNLPWAVEAMAELCTLRSDVVWYIIGYGDDTAIVANIKKHHLEERFVLLGKRDNPYPYIKACDVYVQPSIYEGKAVTVQEAQFLGKPVAISNFPSAHSNVRNGVDGVIFPLGDAHAAALALHNFLSDADKMQKIAKNGARNDFSATASLQAILALSNS